jgi:glycosyltransferase 2 family protein
VTAGDLPAPRSRARRIGGLVAGLLVVGFLAAAVVDGWERVSSYDWHLDLGFLAAALLSLSGSLAVMGVVYVAILERLAARRLPRRRLLSIWARSLLARYVPGNVLMVAARVVLGREAGVQARVSLAASVYEQVAMLVAAALAAIAFLLLWDGDRGPASWLVLAVPVGLILLDPPILRRLSAWLLGRLGRSTEIVALSRRQLAALLAWAALTMGLLATGVALGVDAVAGGLAGDIPSIGLGFLLAWVLSMLAFFFPSGLGVREGAFAVVLARELPSAAAVSLAAASRLLLTAVELAVVAAVVAAGRARR